MIRILLSAFVFLTLSWGAACAQGVPEIAPPGWSMRVSTNSVYLTRPDLPNIQIAIVNDIRPDLTQDEKFEAAKAFFAERAKCPALAQAQTQKSFAGYTAADDPKSPHCRLIAMGHWEKGGLQMALILNMQPALGPNADSYSYQAITQQITTLFTLRYQIGQAGQMPTLSAEAYAQSIPSSHKPAMIIKLIDSVDKYRALTAATLDTKSPLKFPAVMLFPAEDGNTLSWGSHCLDWDPALFAPGDVLKYDKTKECAPFLWRWKDGQENGQIEARGFGQSEWEAFDAFEAAFKHGADYTQMEVKGFYNPMKKGAMLDVAYGVDSDVLEKVAAGSLPASALGPHDIILTPNGRFIAGVLHSATLEGGKIEGGVKGSYYFDGFGVTMLLDDGRVVHGFAGWLPFIIQGDFVRPTAEKTIGSRSALNINGGMYYSACPKDVVCRGRD